MGLFNWIPGMSSTNATKKNNASVNSSMKRVNGVVNQGFKQTPTQAGGVAPVNFEYPANMRQPSDKVMEWATTAGMPAPLTGMRNVAHGGARKTHRKKQKKDKKYKKDKTKKDKRNKKNKSKKNRK
jgi:hypothetical protein